MDPAQLARHYQRFDVANRLLLTGHSHQAWPDVAFEGQQQAWLDAARLVDDKWEAAFDRADRVRRGYARLLGEPDAQIALGQNTLELVVRWLSALPIRERPRLVTTDGEFHTIRRLLDRLAEEGVEVVKVGVAPADTLAERLARAVDGRTAAVLVSSVLYESARIVRGLGEVAAAARRHGAELLVDAYHHLNVVPFSIRELGLEDAFVTSAGYKYAQLGEGNALLRIPPGTELRPVLTGWFSEFSALPDAKRPGVVAYGPGAERFAGATYDSTSHYRAAEVFRFFEEQGLTPPWLRGVNQHQVGLLIDCFDALDLDPRVIDRDRSARLEEVGGFLALRAPRAGEIRAALHARGVYTDSRGPILRLGPAPYLTDAQLERALEILGDVVRDMPG